MRQCPNCGRGSITPIQHKDYEVVLYRCDCCSNEMIIPDPVLHSENIRHDDIGIAGEWADCWGVRNDKEITLNEVKDLGGESIFGDSAYERRISRRENMLTV
jgi:hypothetical protein